MLKERPIATDSPCVPTWTDGTPDYMRLICDYARDSHYLRERGLKPNLLYMAGDCSDAKVLDVGCGVGGILERTVHIEYRDDIALRDNHQKKKNGSGQRFGCPYSGC